MKKEDGYSLVEAVLSLAIASVLLFAFYDLYSSTYRLSQASIERAYAYNIAARYLDQTKYVAASNGYSFDSSSTTVPYKYQPGARGYYHLTATTQAVSGTTYSQTVVTVDWGTATTNRPTISLKTLVRYNGGVYYTGLPPPPPPTFNGSTSAFTSGANLPVATDGQSSVYNNGYAYILGGCTGASDASDLKVQFAAVNANGTTGTWSTTTPLPVADCNNAATVYNNYLYVSGGSSSNLVFYAHINADGSVGAWSSIASSLVPNLYVHSMDAYNGYLYIVGGAYNYATNNPQISYAAINANGSIGSFTNLTNWFADGLSYASPSAIANGFLYTYAQGKIRYGKINANGSIGAATVSAFPVTRNDTTMTILNNYIYIMAGGGTTDVYYAPIDASTGAVGTWTLSSNSLIAPRDSASSFTANGFLYFVNGYAGTPGSNSNIWYALGK